MSAQDVIPCKGTILKVNRGGIFDVEVESGEPPNQITRKIIARCSGKMKKFQIKLVVGDRVDLELSPYDLDKGRITRRLLPER